jgi:hypothetical protein
MHVMTRVVLNVVDRSGRTRRVGKTPMSWTCPTCSRTFAHEGQSHSHDTVSLDHHFVGRPAGHREAFDLLVAALPADVRVEPLRSVVIVAGRTTFAFVIVQARGLRVGIFLDEPIDHPRVQKVDHRSARIVASEVIVRGPGDIDDELRAWLLRAYHFANQAHSNTGE